MENPEFDLEQTLTEAAKMVQELASYNLETWAIQSEVLKLVCSAQDVRALRAVHEDLTVRLMAARN